MLSTCLAIFPDQTYKLIFEPAPMGASPNHIYIKIEPSWMQISVRPYFYYAFIDYFDVPGDYAKQSSSLCANSRINIRSLICARSLYFSL